MVYLCNNFLNCNCYLRWFLIWLLRRLGLIFDGVICYELNDIFGIGLILVNFIFFVCLCVVCKMDVNCSGELVNCFCLDNWVGLFCSDIC